MCHRKNFNIYDFWKSTEKFCLIDNDEKMGAWKYNKT